MKSLLIAAGSVAIMASAAFGQDWDTAPFVTFQPTPFEGLRMDVMTPLDRDDESVILPGVREAIPLQQFGISSSEGRVGEIGQFFLVESNRQIGEARVLLQIEDRSDTFICCWFMER